MRHLLNLFVLSALLPSFATATDYFLSPNGDNAQAGTTPTNAWRTLAYGANKILGGDTLWMRGGTYREQVFFTNNTGSADMPIFIQAYSNEQPVVKGSIVVTNWVYVTNATWKVSNWTNNSQQVFADEALLDNFGWPNEWTQQQACNRASWFIIPPPFSPADVSAVTRSLDIGKPHTNLHPNSFFYDQTNETLYVRLADDSSPTGHTMEVSTFRDLFKEFSKTGFLRMKGIDFRHTSSFGVLDTGSPAVDVGRDGIIEDCTIQWCDAIGLIMLDRSVARNCNISHNGMTGVFIPQVSTFTLNSCELFSNNVRRITLGWASSIKAIPNAGGIIESNNIAYNFANGPWFDTCFDGKKKIIRGNWIHNNCLLPNLPGDSTAHSLMGIFIEKSDNAEVYNNLLENNCNQGIVLSAARNCQVYNNTIIGTHATPGGAPGLAAVKMFNAHNGLTVDRNELYNNLIYENSTVWDLQIGRENPFHVWDNRIDHNLYYRTSGSPVNLTDGGAGNFDLASWRAATGFDADSLAVDPMLDGQSQLLAGSPCIDAGHPTYAVRFDKAMFPRPFHGNAGLPARNDIGCYEYHPASGGLVHVDATGTNPTPPYATAETAATDLSLALNAAVDGQTVLVHPGTYPSDGSFDLDKNIVLHGAGAIEAVRFDGGGTSRALQLSHSNAVVDGVTLQHGSASDGGGVHLASGARIQYSLMVSNQATANGGGLYAEADNLIDRVTLAHNLSGQQGGGIYAKQSANVLRSSLQYNTADEGGGAFLSGQSTASFSTFSNNDADRGAGLFLERSTVSRSELNANHANEWGGGVGLTETSLVERSSIVGNEAGTDGGGFYAGLNSRLENVLVTDNTAMRAGGGLLSNSELVNATVVRNVADQGGGTWPDANARVRNCIVYFNQAATSPNVFVPGTHVYEHTCALPAPAGVNNLDDDPQFVNRGANDFQLLFGSPCIDHATGTDLPALDITHRPRPIDGDGDRSADGDLGAYEFRAIHYVDVSSTNAVRPYMGFDTAANRINDAIQQSFSGDVILVDEGTYLLPASLVLSLSLRVFSLKGPHRTILDGRGLSRCLLISNPNALLEGFTLQNGRADAGGGIYFHFNGLVRNCIIRNCESTGDLGAQFTYTTTPTNRCTFGIDSTIHEGGGGVAMTRGGRLENCLIYSNTAAFGGGILALDGGEVEHVTIVENAARQGGGVYARDAGSVKNSILYFNQGTNGPNLFETGGGISVSYSDVTPLPAGTGNIASNPLFTGTAATNYLLTLGSPAIDAGDLGTVLEDLMNIPRPLDGNNDQDAKPDMGVYEFPHPSADTDADGLSDTNELSRQTNPLNPDTDGDRMTDGEEVVVHSDPLDPHSLLMMHSPFSTATNLPAIRLQWQSHAGAIYTLLRSTNLFATQWRIVESNLVANPPVNTYWDPNTGNHERVFYHVNGR